jgi:hypothetical protein
MIGHNVFDQIVAFADQSGTPRSLIPLEDFEIWQKDYTWDALHGLRYGQSFCSRFNITDNLLYYNSWSIEQTNAYIEKNYIERS